MSATDDVGYQLSLIKREPGESLETLARRGYSMQMEVYSANCGYDLVDESHNWDTESQEARDGWMRWAKERA